VNDPDPDAVRRLYRSGVSAVAEATTGLDDTGWEQPACGQWDVADTTRHLVAVADWYHAWLDRAIDGDASAPFSPAEFEVRNRAEVEARRHLSGAAAATRFVDGANSYLERALPQWDRPFGFPLGTVTVGLHLGVAAAEWHLHTWDLTRSNPIPHSPSDPRELFIATGLAFAEATGGLRGRMMRRAVPLASRRSPWSTMLTRSGRTTQSG
jgi:uncharacterized protein (TIGR03083 family)